MDEKGIMDEIMFNILGLYYELNLKLFRRISTNLILKTKMRMVIAPGRTFIHGQTDK